jgi:hypothetical protein
MWGKYRQRRITRRIRKSQLSASSLVALAGKSCRTESESAIVRPPQYDRIIAETESLSREIREGESWA